MFGQPVGSTNDIEAFAGGPVLVGRRAELLDHWVIGLVRVQRVPNWAFDRLVVLREGPNGESSQRPKYPANALRGHNERAQMLLRRRVHLEVGYVAPAPARDGRL